jgi:hypothetical protein
MGGLEPPIHPARVRAPKRVFARNARAMGGRVKPGHDGAVIKARDLAHR